MFLLFVLLFGRATLGAEHKIASVDDFVQFSKNVSSGISYNGTTVFVDADLDFSGGLSEQQFEPIGNNSSKSFQGTFNGQGHIISNLFVNSSSDYVGLFGYSDGTIRNVVLDTSCSVVSSYSGSDSVCVGGIIGYSSKPNNLGYSVDSCVNLGNVTFTGNQNSGFLYIGGIAGYLSSNANIRNCANVGTVNYSGYKNGGFLYIGGIAGYLSSNANIRNCANVDTVNYNGYQNSGHLYIGGIVGKSSNSIIENCVSGGKVISNKGYIGSVVGYTNYATITHCYWTSDNGHNKACGSGSPSITESTNFSNSTFKLNETVSVGNYTGTSLLAALNAFSDDYYQRSYSHWLLNMDNKEVSFTINNRAKSLTLDSQLILLPSLANEEKLWFDGWYTDSSCTKSLTSFEITSDTPLYGNWEENNYYTITFDTRGGSPVPQPITSHYFSVVSLPSNTIRENCELMWWENDYGDRVPFNFTVPAHNITLHAVWSCLFISAEDLIKFSENVNSGTSYSGATVFLDADIDFSGGLSEQFEPVGKDSIRKYYFQGTFDGQGHIISNLVVKSSSEYIGLFGYSREATIRNVVMDFSCSFVSFL